MIGMHPSVAPPPKKQRTRARHQTKEWHKSQTKRNLAIQRQRQRAENNIVRFMNKEPQLKALYGPSLQVIALDLSKTQEVTHNVELRHSGAKSHLELMMHVVHSMIEAQRLTFHEDENGVALGLPYDIATSAVEEQPAEAIETLVDFDWTTIRIVNCPRRIYAALAEY